MRKFQTAKGISLLSILLVVHWTHMSLHFGRRVTVPLFLRREILANASYAIRKDVMNIETTTTTTVGLTFALLVQIGNIHRKR